MGSKLRGRDLLKLQVLEEAKRKWDRIHALVEQSSVQPTDLEVLMRQCHRTSNDVGRVLLNGGFGQLAGIPTELAFLIKRSGRFESRLGAMRDLIGQGYAGIDRARYKIQHPK